MIKGNMQGLDIAAADVSHAEVIAKELGSKEFCLVMGKPKATPKPRMHCQTRQSFAEHCKREVLEIS
jgi:hypothetical protein